MRCTAPAAHRSISRTPVIPTTFRILVGLGVSLTLATAPAAATPVAPPAAQQPAFETARLPLPAGLRAGAAIMAWSHDDTLELVRAGSNGLFCILDEDDGERLWLECHPQALQRYIERTRALAGAEARDATLRGEIEAGTLSIPLGAMSHNVSGTIDMDTGRAEQVQVWRELAMPFATAAGTGLSTEDRTEFPWLHHPDSPRAHVMVGFRHIAWSELLAGTH